MARLIGLGVLAGSVLAAADVPDLPGIANNKTACLLFHGSGCSTITDANECMNSRDGRFFETLDGGAVRGQPCVWCAGEACTSKTEAKCEPLGWLKAQPQFELFPNYTVAGCFDQRTIHTTSVNVQREIPASTAVYHPKNGGENRACRGTSQVDAGKGNIAGFGGGIAWSYSIWTANSLEECQGYCGSMCTAVEYRAEDLYCEVWFDMVTYTDENEGYECYAKELGCLEKSETGCSGITEESKCISSRDGRNNSMLLNIDIYGSPCVWCGGGSCHTDSTSMCEPLDFLLKGAGAQYEKLKGPDTFKIATCANAGQVGTPMSPESWVLPVPPNPPIDVVIATDKELELPPPVKLPESVTFSTKSPTLAGMDTLGASPDGLDDQGAAAAALDAEKDVADQEPVTPPATDSGAVEATVAPATPTVPPPPAFTVNRAPVGPAAADVVTTAAPVDVSQYEGKFISHSDRGLWFVHNETRYVVSHTGSLEACRKCGCEDVEIVESVNVTVLDAIVISADGFDCSMVRQEESEGFPMWMMIIVPVLLCLLVSACIAYFVRKGTKKGKKQRRNVEGGLATQERDLEVEAPLMSKGVAPVPAVPAPISVTGNRAYAPMDFGEGMPAFTDAPTTLSNAPHCLYGTKLFQGPRVHNAGDQLVINGPPGTMAHVLVGEGNTPEAKAAMRETLAGWDYFDHPMVMDGMQGFRIYVIQIMQPLGISVRVPTIFSVALTQVPVQAQQQQQSFVVTAPMAYTTVYAPGYGPVQGQTMFDRVDRNHDGVITQQEWRAAGLS